MKPRILTDFGKRVRDLRDERGISQERLGELAKRLKIVSLTLSATNIYTAISNYC